MTAGDEVGADASCVSICRHCDEPLSAHCPDCSACPTNDCPDWCEPEEAE